ncbi:MAG: signal recognition particle-docking protein FtsY [Actinomycetaceae bacterium]|nr:signal recognition particle-docking protein FtsY [Actinomycetaceae bacterium]
MVCMLQYFTDPAFSAAVFALIVAVTGAVYFFTRKAKSKGAEPLEGTDEAQSVSSQEIPVEDIDALDEEEAKPKGVSIEHQNTAEDVRDIAPKASQDAQVAAPVEAVQKPEPLATRGQRMRSRLAASGGLGKAILSVFSRGDLSAADWEEIEDTLLMADVGLGPTQELMEKLKTQAKVLATSDKQEIKDVLHQELLSMVGPDMDRALRLDRPRDDQGKELPASILVVGVNGSGKTTTVGKIARILVAEEKSVLLGAADTFRAAACEQLETWGQRVGVRTVRADKEGADPASVAFDTVKRGIDQDVDVVLVDTAGRLQNKADLMDELGKVKRVMEKLAPVTETLLVLDATTGQNGLRQAEVFAEVADITGIVLTKLDGSAKGGIVVAVQRALGVPVKLVGLGEGPDDLAPFDAQDFVKAIIE